MQLVRATLSVCACVVSVAAGCSAFSSEGGGAPDAGSLADASPVDAPSGSDGATGDAGPSAFCAKQIGALFCDDFEANDFDVRWPAKSLSLGVAESVDGAAVGRPGKVLRFLSTKPGGPAETSLYVRKQLGESLPIRVAYDLFMKDWPVVEPSLSGFTAGNAVHGGLSTWLSINSTSKTLGLLAYTGDTTFSNYLPGVPVPLGRWEHYEVVVLPGTPAHFELWVGSPPALIAEDTKPVTLPAGKTLSPTFVEIGFTRSNVGPMPQIEAYYDNVVVTTAP